MNPYRFRVGLPMAMTWQEQLDRSVAAQADRLCNVTCTVGSITLLALLVSIGGLWVLSPSPTGRPYKSIYIDPTNVSGNANDCNIGTAVCPVRTVREAEKRGQDDECH